MMTSDIPAVRWTLRPGKIAAPRAAGRQLRLPLLWLQRLFWRHELKALDLAQMRDCGLDPEEVRREAAKPFWRA
jgi:uncharacterized protein YjiS (DUF1127 family)